MAENRWGFLKWLNGRGFQPEHQYIAYEEAGRSGTDPLPEDAPWVNHIQVVNTGAMRKYIYEPYSSQAVADSTMKEMREAVPLLLWRKTL